MINLSLKNKLALSTLTLLLSPLTSYAFFCPSNFQQINVGQSIEQVQAACGKPDSQDTSTTAINVPQEWSYFIPQTVATGTTNQTSGTLKVSFAFDNNGKLINISVNGIGVGATTICNGNNIQLGATQDQLQTACGKPSNINTENNISGPQQTNTVVTFTYDSNPPVKLTFINGKLQGQQ